MQEVDNRVFPSELVPCGVAMQLLSCNCFTSNIDKKREALHGSISHADGKSKEMIGTFSPQVEPYTHVMPEEMAAIPLTIAEIEVTEKKMDMSLVPNNQTFVSVDDLIPLVC
ncbi:hypothetical protein L1987_41942 [Smallanthus sonchifolius]|uniref:Uncharacterized protein n=1 Tax=Smallanthus sonchifolius TaxID=185202 RepID=A0ACB9GVQ9_9ASTR|nr:hypothetical protein L1987_41942 [Smallanthus sonchifolius]